MWALKTVFTMERPEKIEYDNWTFVSWVIFYSKEHLIINNTQKYM